MARRRRQGRRRRGRSKRGFDAVLRHLRRDWWRAPLLALLFLGFTFWAAERVLPVEPAPQERPSKIIAMPPSRAPHTAHDGYVISASLNVADCSKPVEGSLVVVLPKGFFAAEAEEPWSLLLPVLRKVLFGVAFSDPRVDVTRIVPSDWNREPRGSLASWTWSFSDPTHADADGKVAVARFDNWSKAPDQLEVRFTADWLRPRAYGSCWLPTPEIVGDIQTFTVNASEAVNVSLGKRSGADPLMEGEFSSSSRIEFRYDDGRVGKTRSKTSYTNEYVTFETPPSLGFVQLNSPLSVLPSESVGPMPGVGRPSWTCRGQGGDLLERGQFLGLGQDGAFRWNDDAALDEYMPPDDGTRCEGWVALMEPGAQSKRDLWLLVIGATLSAGVALLIDAVLLQRSKRRRRRDS